jgi:hypothetical protein
MDNNFHELSQHLAYCEIRSENVDILSLNHNHPIYLRNLYDLTIAAAYHPFPIDTLIKYAGYPVRRERVSDGSELWIYELHDTVLDPSEAGVRIFTTKDNTVLCGEISIQDIEDMKQYLSDDDFNSRL